MKYKLGILGKIIMGIIMMLIMSIGLLGAIFLKYCEDKKDDLIIPPRR